MSDLAQVASWTGKTAPAFSPDGLVRAIAEIRQPIHVVRDGARGVIGVALGGDVGRDASPPHPVLGSLPPLYPEWLGDRSFNETHGVRFPYVAGAMANGIATSDLVIAMARAKMLGFFGSAGLTPDQVIAGLDRIEAGLPAGAAYGANLIHSPNEPELERAVSDLFVRRCVRRVSASAYMDVTSALVRYAVSGIRVVDGEIKRDNYVFAKVSRPEVARRMMSPAPTAMLNALVAEGAITEAEAALAKRVPIAEDITVESDSGGHTDNQPLGAVFPIITKLRDELVQKFGYSRPVRVGAAGGLGTPTSVASAFALGAAYVLTGSVNQGAIESGLSPQGKKLLAQASLADVIMAPAADMFELGVKVQVLKRGTMFGPRALRLYDAYVNHASLEAMPDAYRQKLERQVLGETVDSIWERTAAFFKERDPRELERAEREPKHKMALVFRWYLGLSSKWAIAGHPERRLDFQIWCGPAMGAFNDWTKGTFLEEPESRNVVQIAYNLLEGAAVITRAQQLRTYGVPVPSTAFRFVPRPLS